MRLRCAVVTIFSLFVLALPAMATIIDSSGDSKEQALAKQADAFWKANNNTSKAESLYRELLTLDEFNANGLVGMAQVEASRNNLRTAKTYFKKALSQHEGNPRLHAAYGRFLLFSKEVKPAETEFLRAIEINPNLAEAHVELAVIYLSRIQDDQKALFHYKKAIDADPEKVSYRYGYSVALNKTGQQDKAIVQLNEIIKRKPQVALPHMLQGDMALGAQDFPNAIAHYKTAVNKEPENRKALEKLSTAYMYSSDYKGAIGIYKKLLERDTSNAETINKLANAYYFSGSPNKAKEQYKKALSINPNLAESLNNLAHVILENDNNPQLALQYSESAVKLSPNNGSYQRTLAEIKAKLSQ